MELGELEEHSPSRMPVAANALGEWRIHWVLVSDAFAIGPREETEPCMKPGSPVSVIKRSKAKQQWPSHQMGSKWWMEASELPQSINSYTHKNSVVWPSTYGSCFLSTSPFGSAWHQFLSHSNFGKNQVQSHWPSLNPGFLLQTSMSSVVTGFDFFFFKKLELTKCSTCLLSQV